MTLLLLFSIIFKGRNVRSIRQYHLLENYINSILGTLSREKKEKERKRERDTL